MSQAIALYRIYELPWSTGAEQEHRFQRIVVSCVAGALVLALILSFLPLPRRDIGQTQEVPKRLARLVVERQKPPPPPPPPVVKETPTATGDRGGAAAEETGTGAGREA